jgi:hypothetical protein
MLELNLGNPSFKAVVPRNGGYVPSVEFVTPNETRVQLIGYGGGNSIYVQKKGEANATRVMHWGVEKNKASEGYGAASYTLPFFKQFVQDQETPQKTAEAVAAVAKDFCNQVLDAAAEALDSEDGVLFLAKIVEDNKTNPAPAKQRSGFSKILGVMSNHFNCAKKATDADSYLALRAASEQRRSNNSNNVDVLSGATAQITF